MMRVAITFAAVAAMTLPEISAVTTALTHQGGKTMLRNGRKAVQNTTNALPDPHCSTGIVSLPLYPSLKSVCCPNYCGECGDYATCSSVRNQQSENACCASNVLKMECGSPSGAPANVCLKKCSSSLPPCIMEDGELKVGKANPSASSDCGNAVKEWRLKVAAAVGAGGGDQVPKPEIQIIEPEIRIIEKPAKTVEEVAEVPQITAQAKTMSLVGNGCCRFDGWSAAEKGRQTEEMCNQICLKDPSCIFAEIEWAVGDEYDCWIFFGTGDNFKLEDCHMTKCFRKG